MFQSATKTNTEMRAFHQATLTLPPTCKLASCFSSACHRLRLVAAVALLAAGFAVLAQAAEGGWGRPARNERSIPRNEGRAPRAQAADGEAREDFSSDPGWDARNVVPDPSAHVTTVQDFGFSRSRHAGGEAHEIGGPIARSLTPAFYAKKIPRGTLDDRLQASGRFSVTRSAGASGVLFGWFHSAARGWRTPNSLVFRIDGEDGKFRVLFEYGTRTLKTGGGTTFEGRYQTTSTPMHPADGSPHTWALDYNPQGAGGNGQVTFVLDGQVYKTALAPGHRAEGAVFDRFGIMNVQVSGGTITPWFDDLVVNGVKEDFATDPHWEGCGNRVTFEDRGVRPQHDFGYRTSRYAGGQPGEAGGLMWRIESAQPQNAGYYAAPVGRLSLDTELVASGTVCLRGAASDSGILVGWFNSLTAIGAPPANFLGILIEGPSRIGHYFRPAYGTSDDIKAVAEKGPVIQPDGKPHRWTVRYAPAANEGRGRITVTFDDESVSMDLKEGARHGNAALNRFGFVSFNRGGNYVDIYFDNLVFTAQGRQQEK